MDAITFLIKEHNQVRKTFAIINKKIQRYTTKRKKFVALCQDLIRHETMEQKIWYPHFRNSKKLKKEVRHLVSEEKHAEKAIKKILNIKNEAEWETKFLKFKSDVEHHAKEEERDLFPNVAQILDKEDLEIIGKKMRVFKTNFNKKLKAKSKKKK